MLPVPEPEHLDVTDLDGAASRRRPGRQMVLSAQSEYSGSCRPTFSVACEPSLWPGLHRATGNGFRTPETKGPNPASGRSSFPAETANGPLHPPQTAENRGCSAQTGNSGLAQDCVVGLGGLEPATRRLSAPTGEFRIGAHKTQHVVPTLFKFGARYRCALAPKGFSAKCQIRRCVAGKTVTDESSAPHALLGCPP
jgi:hypothetical protein